MNIKTKLTLVIGILVSMIVLLVSLSIVNLQILTATEPNSPAAGPGLHRALLWISVVGSCCIVIGCFVLTIFPSYFNKPIKEIIDGIKDIANHNYNHRLDLKSHEFEEVSKTSTVWPNASPTTIPAPSHRSKRPKTTWKPSSTVSKNPS